MPLYCLVLLVKAPTMANGENINMAERDGIAEQPGTVFWCCW